MPSTTPPVVDSGIVQISEPLLELDEIQGNVLVGFANTRQTLLFLRVEPEALEAFRRWLAVLVPEITSAARTLEARAHPTPPDALNIAFSHAALVRLAAGRDGDLSRTDFGDRAFVSGMAPRSSALGDPNDAAMPGHVSRWLVGSADTQFACVLIVAANEQPAIDRRIAVLQSRLPAGVTIVRREDGAKLPGAREHFGYRDGISQPGIRGFIDTNGTRLTARAASNPQEGSSGQDLIWPGEFVFGYPGQDATDADRPTPAPVSAGPAWAKNGSLLVFRRLRQDVFALREFVAGQGSDPELTGARLVGRWKSGAPLVVTPTADDPPLARDSSRNNVFGFSALDANGLRCPLHAHIRKAYARDDRPTSEVRSRRLLRRGISYGPPASAGGADDAVDRGLLFLAYQTSFERQFEAVMGQVNDPSFAGAGSDRDALLTGAQAGKPFVVTTGGEYLFAPAIAALVMLSKP